MRSIVILLAGLVFSSQVAASEVGRSSKQATPLLELYTSEGCSSCPPAEQWVSKLTGHAGLWTHFVPVVFHVDYWDGLGWPDRFANGEFTLRQRRYAAQWGTSTIYTPGFVLEGKEVRGRPQLPKELSGNVGELIIRKIERDSYELLFEPVGDYSGGTANLALLGFNLTTQVAAGENAGRRLAHDFVVLDWQTAKLTSSVEGRWSAKFQVPGAPGELALAAWVTDGNSQSPIQAAGGWIGDSSR